MPLNRRRGLRPPVPNRRTRPQRPTSADLQCGRLPPTPLGNARPRAVAHHLAVRPAHSPKARDDRSRDQDRRSPGRDRRRLPVRTADEWSTAPPVVGTDARSTRPSTPRPRRRQLCRRDLVASRHGPRGGWCRVSPPAAAAPVGPPPHRVGWPHRDCGRAARRFHGLHPRPDRARGCHRVRRYRSPGREIGSSVSTERTRQRPGSPRNCPIPAGARSSR